MITSEKVELEEKLGEYLEDVWKCIRCGFCNSVCPTSTIPRAYMASLTSRGRLILLQAYFSNILDKPLTDEKIQELMEYCFGCRRCIEVCPPGVRIPNLVWRIKQFKREKSYLKRTIFAHYGETLKLLSNIPSISNLLLHSYIGKLLLESVAGISKEIDFPTIYPSLEKWIRGREKSHGHRGKLAYFIDVFTNYHEVDLGKKIVGLVEDLGYVVVAPPQREAGTLLLEEGLIDEAYRVAKKNTENLYSAIQDGARVLTSSPAAYLALKKDYPELLCDSKSRIVSENTIDILELLLKEYEEDVIDFDKNTEAQIVYHHSCFTKASGLTKDIRRLLTSAGYMLKEVDMCCGIGGVWGMSKRHYLESIEIGLDLFNKLKRMKLPVASQSETCRLQIRNNSSVEVGHPFSFVRGRVKIKK